MLIGDEVIIRKLSEQLNLPLNICRLIYVEFKRVVIDEVSLGNRVRITNFGSFFKRTRKGRTIADPRDFSKLMTCENTDVVKFIPSKTFKRKIK
jgi:nucleoid DNA-binding protein